MFAGHAALATYAKGKRPTIPMWLLAGVAFAPDWIQWVMEAAGHHNPQYSHSIVSIGVLATVLSLAYWLVRRDGTDAATLWLLYASHWFADLVTGIKPTWPGGPMVGLGLYGRPAWDLVIEIVVIAGCWLVYRASLEARARRGALALLLPLGLVAMQVGFELIQRPDVREALRQLP